MDYREEPGVVLTVQAGRATVRLNRRDPAACGSCCVCAGAGAGPTTHEVGSAVDGVDLVPGERVILSVPAVNAYFVMALVFALPMAMFVVGVLVGHAFESGDEFGGTSVLSGIAGFLLAYGVAWFVNRRVRRSAPVGVRRAPQGEESCSHAAPEA